MKAPFEKFEMFVAADGFTVEVRPVARSGRMLDAQMKFIETAIRNELARTANTQEGNA